MGLRPAAVTVLTIALVLTGCGASETRAVTTTAPPETTSTTIIPEPVGPPPKLELTPVATVAAPTVLTTRDGDDSLYVAEKAGVIRTIKGEGGVVDATPVLDIHNEVSNDGERGLLGLAFAPNKNVFYVDYTDLAGDTHIDEYTLDNGGRADARSKREILYVKQPYPNHNGGQLAFGPEGALYIGLGDGGSSGDPEKRAQNLTELLGKILRIRPEVQSNGKPYSIPFDNPFTKQAGARGEIWAYGLRNPWRFSFDTKTRGIWIADVGQNKYEEIDHLNLDPKGGTNYGWPLREGTHKYDGEAPKGAVEPVYDYDHSNGACSLTGGYVYRGKAIPDMTGRYLFGDFCNGAVSALTKRGTVWEADRLNFDVAQIDSFGQDHAGEIYTLSLNGQISRIDAAK